MSLTNFVDGYGRSMAQIMVDRRSEFMAVPNLWRTKNQRYRLQGEICPACSNAVFPPRQVCPRCGSSMDERHSHRNQKPVMVVAYHAQPALVEAPAGDD